MIAVASRIVIADDARIVPEHDARPSPRSMTRRAGAATLPLVKLTILAVALTACAIAAAPASADSIVYAKQGNLYLTSPDGSKGYQLTFDGGYSSPSQADNGTIGALRYDKLVRLDRHGRMLNKPIAAMGSDGPSNSHGIGGPYGPRISPDGKRFAYYFYVQTSWDDWENYEIHLDTGSYGTWTWADHFTSPATESEFEKSLTQTEWVTNDRLLGTQGFWMNMWTWKLGTGHGYTSDAAQWWFGLQDPPDDTGFAPYHWYNDPALSRDGKRLAMTDGGGGDSQLLIAATHGPAWTGNPPYPEPDYVGQTSDLARPTIECATARGQYANPSWSADGRQVAYGTSDGVHVITLPSFDCAQATERIVARGGTEPAFGPADVRIADAPRHSGGGVRISRVSVRPRSIRAGHGGRVRFTLSRRARVAVMADGIGVRVRGRRGVNTVRPRFLRGLHPGHYRLTVNVGRSVAHARFSVR
jgi:WD40 repeat protein